MRDQSLFESALHRPQNLAAYGEHDVAALAASYGYVVARNHPLINGNNRTAFVAVELFLTLNGWQSERASVCGPDAAACSRKWLNGSVQGLAAKRASTKRLFCESTACQQWPVRCMRDQRSLRVNLPMQ